MQENTTAHTANNFLDVLDEVFGYESSASMINPSYPLNLSVGHAEGNSAC
jgi:hypothetical protein